MENNPKSEYLRILYKINEIYSKLFPKGKYDLPESISVSIKNVDKLTLIIKAEGTSVNGLHADWLNPILVR